MDGWIIPAAGLAIVVLSSAIGVTWKLSRVEVALRAEYQLEIAALKEKVYKVEIWARDEFVRKGSFESAVNRIEHDIDSLGTRIENAVEKMRAAVERATQGHHRPAE